MSLHLRLATPEDVPGLLTRLPEWTRAFATPDYLPAHVEIALREAFGPTLHRIGLGTWYVVLATTGETIACGGWSRHRDPPQADAPRDPEREPARILCAFIAPDHARAGLGAVLLARCESEAQQAGFSQGELLSTPAAVPLYESYGYIAGEATRRRLPGGIELRLVPMQKTLSTP